MLTGLRPEPVGAGGEEDLVATLPGGAPPVLRDLVRSLLAPDLRDRPASASDARARLDHPDLAWREGAMGEVEVLDHLAEPGAAHEDPLPRPGARSAPHDDPLPRPGARSAHDGTEDRAGEGGGARTAYDQTPALPWWEGRGLVVVLAAVAALSAVVLLWALAQLL